jgi:hypothetical protein
LKTIIVCSHEAATRRRYFDMHAKQQRTEPGSVRRARKTTD